MYSLCLNVSGAKSVQEFIEHFGDAIGFSPSFNALNNMLNWVESFIPGIKKTGIGLNEVNK